MQMRACEICGTHARTPLVRGRDRQHGVAGSWQLARCDGCGLVAIEPLPSAAEIARFYPPGDYYAHRASRATFRPVRVSAVKRFVLRHRFGYPPQPSGGAFARATALALTAVVSRKYLLPWVGEGRLLDVGCGVGSALWRLRAFGWDARGLELDDAAAAIGRAHGLDITTGELESAPFAAQSFDVVRLSHVLEHARQPVAVLRAARRLLAPNGRLLLTLPNIASRGFRCFGANWFPLELPRHLFHFSPDTLRAACAAAGLEVASLRCRSNAELWLRSRQYAREEQAAARGVSAAGGPLYRSRWRRRVFAGWVRWLDWAGEGDLLECTCRVAGSGAEHA